MVAADLEFGSRLDGRTKKSIRVLFRSLKGALIASLAVQSPVTPGDVLPVDLGSSHNDRDRSGRIAISRRVAEGQVFLTNSVAQADLTSAEAAAASRTTIVSIRDDGVPFGIDQHRAELTARARAHLRNRQAVLDPRCQMLLVHLVPLE